MLVHFHSTVPQSEGRSWDKAAALGKILLSSAGMDGLVRGLLSIENEYF